MVLKNPALVGRTAELNTLLDFMDSTVKAKGRTIFISGEAGSGKTRLVNEFLNTVTQKDANILTGWCLSNAGVAYFPFIEAFCSSYSDLQELLTSAPIQRMNQTERLMPYIENEYTNNQHSPRAWMDLTFSSVTKELLNLSTKKPLVLVLEDIHWADSASLALLHYISRFVFEEHILLIATFRSENLNYNLEGQPSALVETLRAMRREDLFYELKITNLNKFEVGLMATSMLGNPLQETFLEKLSLESLGNALFVVESLRMLASSGCLIQENNHWRPLTDEIKIPSKVKDLILQRADNLKLKQRKILDIASVIGEKFDYKLIASVLGQEQLQILEKLNSIARTTQLVKFDQNSFAFDHAKSREILYDDLPKPLKTGYHQAIAERLESISKTERKNIASELAYHYEKAENPSKTLAYSLLAGKEAIAKFSNIEAKNYFSHVLEIAKDNKNFQNERMAAIEGLGDAAYAAGEFQEAQKSFNQLSQDTSNDTISLRALRKAIATARCIGNFDGSLEIAKKAEALKEANTLEYARVLLISGAALGSSGKPKEALIALEKALAVFEDQNSLPDLAQALNEIASIYQTEGFPEKAIVAAKLAIELNEAIGDMRGQVDAYFYAGQVFFNYRLHKNALEFFDRAYEIAEKIGYNNRLCWVPIYSAITLDIIGDLNSAISKNLLAVKNAEKTDSPYTQSQSIANLLALYSKSGDIENAQKYYDKMKQLFPDESKVGSKLGYSAMIKAQALFFALKEDWIKSNQLFDLSLNLLRGALFAKSFEANTRMDYAIILDKQKRIQDSVTQREIASMLTNAVENQFRSFNIVAALMVKRNMSVGEEIEVILDLVNVSRIDGFLIKINHPYPSEFNVRQMPNCRKLMKDTMDFDNQLIEPFQIFTIRIPLIALKEGECIFAPEVICQSEAGDKKIIKVKPIKSRIHSVISPNQDLSKEIQNNNSSGGQIAALSGNGIEFQFGGQAAKNIFDYLIKAFIQDYMRSRLPLDRSGWRTLVGVAKQGKVPISALYGRKGRFGRAVGELQRRGLIEIRFFPGERGRGGKIMKLRVCYEKEPIKRQIDQKVAA